MSTDKRERQKANRAAKVAAQRAAARRRRNRKLMFGVGGVAVLVLVVWVIVTLGDQGSSSSSTTTAASDGVDTTSAAADASQSDSEYARYLAQPTACGGTAPEGFTPLQFDAPDQLDLSGTPTATIQTSCGSVEIALDADSYPETVNSFAFLAEEGYFDGSACQRVVSGFMIQCGDPTATGGGGPGYVVPDDFPPEGFVYEKGVVAMANAGSNTTGSQFFIVTGDASHLPAAYSILGEVVDGWDTLEALEAVPVGTSPTGEVSDPEESIYIESVTIEK